MDNVCYKLMFFIGILDMLLMFMNALETGILGIIGAVYCDYPLLIYSSGFLGGALWYAETSAELLLAINRCMELLRPQIGQIYIIVGTYAWVFTNGCPPVVYLLLNKRIRIDCVNFGRAILRFLRNGNNSVTNGPIAMAWMTPNYAVNNANNRIGPQQ
ncbi:hypothetical protein niasHT_037321 [Heterodera trifolii]|uniref:Uncharacterized protein n=1 Tax=Heterodera trifolii TaxID=157864 RepID=A0ABD2J4S6_9BILA